MKMKPVDVKSSAYIDFDKKKYKEDTNFNVGDHIRISKHKNIFTKGFVTNSVPWAYVISDLNGEEIV